MTDDSPDVGDGTVRRYDPETDREALWSLKSRFERGLGSGTGDDAKQQRYDEKLTDDYRERYLDWVAWCVRQDPDCVTVAERADADESAPESLVGYDFVLPQQLAMIWDAAVLNEIYVAPEWRGTGVADDLMESAIACAESQDLPLDRLVLDVDRKNERAQAFYERYGFEHWGEMVARTLE